MEYTHSGSPRLQTADQIKTAFTGPTSPQPKNFIEDAVQRILKVCGCLTSTREKLDANANRLFGPLLEECGEEDASDAADTLQYRLIFALQALEKEQSLLAEAANRNCFAV